LGGSDLNPPPSTVQRPPSFLIQAVKDSEGANLERVDANGKLPAIGTTVDVATATYTNDIGAVRLETTWKDPIFDASQAAFYYVRVLEIPTPRWTTYDATALGLAPLSEVPISTQERAWSSPIWYNPR